MARPEWMRTVLFRVRKLLGLEKYTCVICGKTFNKAWMDEEAAAEYERLYGSKGNGWERSDAQACDDCWKASGLDTGDEKKWKGPAAAAKAVSERREAKHG